MNKKIFILSFLFPLVCCAGKYQQKIDRRIDFHGVSIRQRTFKRSGAHRRQIPKLLARFNWNPTALALAFKREGKWWPKGLQYDDSLFKEARERLQDMRAVDLGFELVKEGESGARLLKLLIDAEQLAPDAAQLQEGMQFSLFDAVASFGSINAMKVLLSHPEDVCIDGSGRYVFTPLMLAVRNGKHKAVGFLLGRGADKDRQVPSVPYAVRNRLVSYTAHALGLILAQNEACRVLDAAQS